VWSKAISAKGTMVKRMNEMGAVATPGSAADFGNFVEAETVMWTKVIKAANIQAG
jgi:tripartite-type tricarboxylate transporter receptor subunit TctC